MQIEDKDIALFWEDPKAHAPRRVPPEVRKALYRKLQLLDAACTLDDLRIPPGNRLEALKGKRSGQYSIRVNGQYRLCFTWASDEARGVEFVDYH